MRSACLLLPRTPCPWHDHLTLSPPPAAAASQPARRNGWCPGQDVAPWVADVTAALSPQGQPNSIAYRGVLLNGSEPLRPAGVLLMQSNLVFQLGC